MYREAFVRSMVSFDLCWEVETFYMSFMQAVFRILFAPMTVSLGIAGSSAAALAAAYIAEYGFELLPCILCLYQRIPFAANIALGLVAAAAFFYGRRPMGAVIVILAGVVFLGNAALAFYHVGVEQHWWVSAFEACTFDPNNLRAALDQPAVPCDEIPWEMFGISMAGYNVIMCGVAGVLSIGLGFKFLLKKP